MRAYKPLIIQLEGIRYKLYKDSKGLLTIGCGHLVLPDENFKGVTLTDAQVMDLLQKDLLPVEKYVTMITLNWKTPPTEQQFSVLCSFCFQYGTNLAKRFPNTYATFLSGDPERICDALMQFTNVDPKKKDGKLLKRRLVEIELFNKKEF